MFYKIEKLFVIMALLVAVMLMFAACESAGEMGTTAGRISVMQELYRVAVL